MGGAQAKPIKSITGVKWMGVKNLTGSSEDLKIKQEVLMMTMKPPHFNFETNKDELYKINSTGKICFAQFPRNTKLF